MQGSPGFSVDNSVLGPLKKINFVYGPNGAGKTTISRALADPTRYPRIVLDTSDPASIIEIKVYNRDYVTQTLRESHRLPGVFTLDDEDPQAREHLNTLTKEGGVIDQLQAKLQAERKTHEAIVSSANARREHLKEFAWAKRTEIPDELHPMFEGFKWKEKLLSKLLSTSKASPPRLEDLKREAASAFDTEAVVVPEIKPIVRGSWMTMAGFSLLGATVAGSSEISLSELIATLDNGDWVAQGGEYLSRSNNVCPFCQQELPIDFLREFAEHFDQRYREQVGDLNHLSRAFKEFAEQARSWWDAMAQVDHNFINQELMATTRSNWEVLLTRAESSLRAKVTNPSRQVALDDFSSLIDEADQIAVTANELIRAHNERIRSRATARKDLIGRCWTYFAWGVLGPETESFVSKLAGSDQALKESAAAVTNAQTALDETMARAKEIERGLVSSAPTIERINNLLTRVGFTTFRITQSAAIPDGYSLTRPDGEKAEESLSDGERTLITFLYYVAQLQGAAASASSQQLAAVIDDPISSLDSDILFVVSSLVRSIMESVNQDDTRLKQMVVLTHNVHFYLEVTYLRLQDQRNGLAANRQHFEIVKNPETGSTVRATKDGAIKSSYARLWDEVRSASEATGPVSVGLENVMRRILENYFKILGGVPAIDDLTAHFVGDDVTICRTLFSWLNHGSHSFFDEIDYSTHGMSVDAYLKVFREIFEQTNQLGHYQMMMNRDES